jgi:ABC-type transport system involved in multi-copper enzyme maturation permease subunit
MSKGVTGKVVTVIISIILALFALIVLWIVFTKLMNGITGGIPDIIFNIKCSFCDKLGIFNKIGGMCKACQ